MEAALKIRDVTHWWGQVRSSEMRTSLRQYANGESGAGVLSAGPAQAGALRIHLQPRQHRGCKHRQIPTNATIVAYVQGLQIRHVCPRCGQRSHDCSVS